MIYSNQNTNSMAMKNLERHLHEGGCIEKGLIVSSNLINKMEVCGFVNMRSANELNMEKIFEGSLSLINKAPYKQFVMSGYICQIHQYVKRTGISSEICTKGVTAPIYYSLKIHHQMLEVNMEDVAIPSLEDNRTYNKIRSRYGTGIVVTESMLYKVFPKEYSVTVKEGKAILEVPAESVLCLDRKGNIKSVGEEILAVCRYLDSETGILNYALYSLDELFTI